MELLDALRTTGSIREFTSEPVPDQVIFELLDIARFAPSGGNRQAWHVIVVKDNEKRRKIRDCYLDAWHDYVSHLLAGLIPFSPLASEEDRLLAISKRSDAEALSKPEGFAESMDEAPLLLVVCANLAVLAATDRDLDRYQIAGGASLYPFVWNILLAAREFDLGGVMTTVGIRNEPALKEILSIPETVGVAAIMALGHPQKRHTKLKRRAVNEFTTQDRYDGPVFGA